MSADSPFGPPAQIAPVPPPPTVERRAPTPTQDISAAPAGTMVLVPKVQDSGGGNLPEHVAVPTVSKFADPTFMLTASGALLVLVDPVVTLLQSKDAIIDWKGFAASIILALAAYFRTRMNTVTK